MAGGEPSSRTIKEPFVSKNVAVFVDVANIFYAAKAAGTDIDYVTLLKAAVAGRDFVRAYAYTGLDPENENQRNFHSFLARHGYKVVSKDIRKYGDGKVKANLDIELVVDMMKTSRNLDVAVIVSGDGDFAPAIRAVQEMGVRVEVISFRGNTSSDLVDAADAFYDITQLAKVDRDSTRSGRRVAGDEEDLSMTEVPEKQTEGRGGRRGRGTRRGKAVAEEAGAARSGGRLVALPGERLSRAPASGEAGEAEEEAGEEAAEGQEAGEVAAEGGRRRRRRGGRGRGHGGRGREEFARSEEEGEEEAVSAAPTNRPNQFGSVWDSQIGMAGGPERLAPVGPADEDDYAEPEIPEYLLAERKRGGRGRGGRGSRSAYASAVERERFGRSSLRYPEPARQPQPQRRREERPQRQQPPQQHRGGGPQRGGGRGSAEPWSEVPPELEELLRAQLSSRLTRQAEEPAEAPSDGEGGEATEAMAEATLVEAAPKRRAPARKKAGEPAEAPSDGEGGEAAPEAKPTRGRKKAATAEASTAAEGAQAEAAPKRRAPARKKAAAPAAGEAVGEGEAAGEAAVEASAEPVAE
jgi:uncharacterized LabA/DUF88 family protein